ncbi:Eco29kI family restriction endonuclease [Shewanella sp. SP1S2-4]|uniref:Eco29kI family restriction endonuclease n=1 Tax=Shewanella sp. SP1S2-4 TaxID=3063537 RepID=UPI00288C7E83|nr:Eco29kI family restriction endonuclease [Shewanella sp. SP1S2-4]MDT3322017.1 Eco29kI family restriction endonuclease [Shewanella sp. SP1S2-4]
MDNEVKKARGVIEWSNDLFAATAMAPEFSSEKLTTANLKKVRNDIDKVLKKLSAVAAQLDPIKQPNSVFDPSNPEAVGRVVAMALLSQHKRSLLSIPRFYGSGIYAIYYTGSFSEYSPLAGADHPIYVGKADPLSPKARYPQEQGEKLCSRLKEHLKSIKKATNLNTEDFQCRFLIVASGWQEAAERYLINLYKPIWNKETKICYGIGKHGDSAGTRGNKRSPWDTMHSGREWAEHTIDDQVSKDKIIDMLTHHFRSNPPIVDKQKAVDTFLEEMCQHHN